MAGPVAPNTTAVVQQIQTELQALLLADNVTHAYQSVIIGGEKDYTEIPLPCATLIPRHDDSQRHAFGGTIIEHTDIEVRSIVDYTTTNTAAQAELQILSIRDALMPLLNKYAVLPNTLTVYNAKIKPNSAAFAWMFLKPNWYRIHTVTLEVAQYYVISGGIQ
ncbi:MAG TPA: hypothetical protein VFN23_04375 [Ktedonobacteraceae bacterium]|nr:hypothetical protein [Ktedonobacteraceae bacterium]